jgi:uncharacterized protein
MVVKVEQIREKGLVLDEPVTTAFLENALHFEGNDTGFRAEKSSALHAVFRKVSGGVLLQASLTLELMAPCKRCLADVRFSLPVEFTLNLVPQTQVARSDAEDEEDPSDSEAEGSFAFPEADEEVFDGKVIDLDPILREQVLLALPMDVVCGEACKGLCPVCGQNRNEKACSCEPKIPDPRWMALKDIKLS